MNSSQIMVPVDVPLEIHLNATQDDEVYPIPCVSNTNIPFMVRVWIELQVTKNFKAKKGDEQSYSLTGTFTFEVLLDINLRGQAYKADCQTVCPMFVADWAEKEAKKNYNQKYQRAM